MTEDGPIAVREGDLIAGKYRVEGVIGIGGMGVVVSARHEQLDQRVAIKLVRDQALHSEGGVQRFLREARAAAKLKSEHAARVLDVGTFASGAPYMVMEFLDGADLGQVLEQRGPLPVELAAEWIAQACEALAEAHAAGIVHRDLKPQNLFVAHTVGGAAMIKVLDFGVSKSIEAMGGGRGALTRTRAMLGSPLYMAPEQMRSSRDVDARADVWALGIVLFELLTRRWPFEAETLPELCLKVVSDPPQSLSELRPDVPDAMVRIVERCLEKEAERRFANAAELAIALEPLVPPGSRMVVERARLAMANPRRLTTPVETRTLEGSLTAETDKAPTRAGPTPAAWGAKGGARTMTKRGLALWTSAAVLVVGGAVGAAVLSRGDRSAQPPPGATPAPMGAAASELPKQEKVVANPVAAFTLTPPTNQVDSAPPPAIAKEETTPSRAIVAPSLPATNQVPVVRVAPVSKEPARDDDIPALR
jgi:serine/threonine-protein kinase